MIVRRYALRAPLDLAAAGTFQYEVPCAGARKVVFTFRATNGNLLASAALERKNIFDLDGWQSAPANDFIPTGDSLVATLNNSVPPSTVAAGRDATFAAAGDIYHSPKVRVNGVNGAGIITGFEVSAVVCYNTEPVVGVGA